MCKGVVTAAGAGVFLIAASNLAPWWVPALRFIGDWPGVMVMRANTGTAIAGAGLSLLMWRFAQGTKAGSWQRWAACLFGTVAAVIGGLTSLEYLAGINLGIDTLLAPATFPQDHANAFVSAPGRMSLNAALSLFFLGLSLLGLDWSVNLGRPRRVFLAPMLAVASALPAAFGLVGYLSGTGGFTGLLKSTNILMHTASALILVALGVLAARSDRQPVKRILSKGAGGMLLRWLLPGSTAALIILSWMIGKGRAWGVVAPGEGTALMLFGGLILLYGLIVAASRAADDEEAKALRAHSAMRDQEKRSRSILETSLDGVLLMDMAGRVVDWNLAAEQLFGWRREEILGRPLADHIIPERLREAHSRGLERYLETGTARVLGQRLELPALRRDGSEFSVELSINLVAGETPPMFVGFIRDITERQRAEQALREAKDQAEKASQAKDDFLAALSHELRTPLTPVLLTASVLNEDPRLPEDVRRSLAMIERHVTLEARLIDDLLDLTRISRGKLLLRTEQCDVHALIRHALDIIREDAAGKNLTLTLKLDMPYVRLAGDPARLQQVFWNLLKNAVKFTPAGGIITVTSRHVVQKNCLEVEVRDNGMGFEPGLADQLFLPFEQEKSEVHHQFGGLGLGLAIARAIMELHGGTIRAESGGPGQGAAFIVTLPCDTAVLEETSAAPSPQSLAVGASRQPRHILLVEDHEPTRQVLERLLKRVGHRVTAAGSVAEAVLAAEESAADVLISDLGLPDGSGLDVMRELKARDLMLPGIALSGYGMEDDQQRTSEAGFACHLVKPVKFEQLLQALDELEKTAS